MIRYYFETHLNLRTKDVNFFSRSVWSIRFWGLFFFYVVKGTTSFYTTAEGRTEGEKCNPEAGAETSKTSPVLHESLSENLKKLLGQLASEERDLTFFTVTPSTCQHLSDWLDVQDLHFRLQTFLTQERINKQKKTAFSLGTDLALVCQDSQTPIHSQCVRTSRNFVWIKSSGL